MTANSAHYQLHSYRKEFLLYNIVLKSNCCVDHFCPLGGSTRQRCVWSAASVRWRSEHNSQCAAASQRTEQHPVDQSACTIHLFPLTLKGVCVFLVESYLICILHEDRLRKPERNPRTCEGEFEQTIPFGLPPLCLPAFCQESYFLPPEETWAFYCELWLNLKCLFYLVIWICVRKTSAVSA